MSIDNTVVVTGNVTYEPELAFTASGYAVANFSVAVNRRWQNRESQEWEEAVSFFEVTAWGDLAENVADTIAKGSRVTVTGRLEQRTWEADDGSKRSEVRIVADDVAASLRWATADIVRTEPKKPTTAKAKSASKRAERSATRKRAPHRRNAEDIDSE